MASSLCGCTLLLLALLPVLRAAAAAGSDGGGLAASESAEPDAEEGIRVLEADVPRLGDCIRIGEQVIRYKPVGLEANKQYEARISYPASNPVRVLLQLAPPGGWQGSWVGRRRASRKLLDAEKILFSTDWSGKVWVDPHHAAEVEVLFQAERWVQHRGGEAAAPKTLVYDIVLEQSFLGLPKSSTPVAAWAVVLVMASVAAAPVWSSRAVPYVLSWLARPSGQPRKR